MTVYQPLAADHAPGAEPQQAPAIAARAAAVSRLPDDMAMIRTAAELTRDLSAPNPRTYWLDCMGSAVVGYAAMAVAVTASSVGVIVAAAVVAILALYRAGSFIHEISHIKRSALPGFWLGWNMVVGIPLLIPSFMYEGVHNLHHARTRYGTSEDPEYLPLALMHWWTVPLFVAVSALAPVGLLIRYGILSPLSAIIPPLRRLVVARYSGLVINPAFRRRAPEGQARTEWLWLETAASIWAIALIAGVASGAIPLGPFMIALGIVAMTLVLNQVRTLVAHLWENDGEVMTTTAQYLDSVNVPPPALLPALWAPVGLRYHALHHLLPGLPYHALGEAHRRISAALADNPTYARASYPGLPGLVARLMTHAGKTA
ncbi:MAG: fatty acid desaturase [Sphingopyxis sp.]|nr:fatty acid desaturase [Sphingopyxis sp.]